MRLLPIALPASILLCAAATAQPHAPAGSVIEGGDSVEECIYQYLTTARLDGRTAPSSSGRIIRTVERNRRIDANDRSEAWTVVRRPGRLRAERTITLAGAQRFGTRTMIRRSDGPSSFTTLRIPAGGTLQYLVDVGEGFAYVRYDGVVYLTDGIIVGPYTYDDRRTTRQMTDFSIVTEPEADLWLRLVARDGKPAAWVEVSGRMEVLGCDGWSD